MEVLGIYTRVICIRQGVGVDVGAKACRCRCSRRMREGVQEEEPKTFNARVLNLEQSLKENLYTTLRDDLAFL